MPKGYTVASIVETVALKPGGQVEKVYRVQGTTTAGVNFSLDIPEKDFTKEEVDKRLSEKASLLDSVMKS